jgi:hypothetical protein
MVSLMGIRIDDNPRGAFSDAGRFRFSALGGGHLDFLVAGYDTSSPSGSPSGKPVGSVNNPPCMPNRRARLCDEGSEETAGWLRTLALAGRSDALGNVR